jgi:hypothetical protein
VRKRCTEIAEHDGGSVHSDDCGHRGLCRGHCRIDHCSDDHRINRRVGE